MNDKKKYGFGGRVKVSVKNIVTTGDPKTYSPSEIKQILGEHNAYL